MGLRVVRPVSCSSLLLGLALSAACAPPPTPPPPVPLAFAPAGPDATPAPSTFGPFAVGVRTVEVVDDSRLDRATGEPRRLTVEIWYPAEETARGQPGRSYDVREYVPPEKQAEIAPGAIPLLQTTSVADAEPRRAEGPYPLVVFSHGKGGMRWQSTYFTETLASHGYVVVAPDHRGDTLDTLLGGAPGFDTTIVLRALERADDVIFLLDQFTEDLAGTDPLAGLIDAAHIGVAGHSFGGFTSLRSAALDGRIDAIVPMAPPSADLAWFDLGLGHTSSLPTMVQAARLDQTLGWDDNVATTWPLLTGPRWLVEVKTGGHFSFSNLCGFELAEVAAGIEIEGLSREDVEGALNDGCVAPAPSSAQLLPALNHYAIGFFNGYLRGSTGSFALLDEAHAETLLAGGLAVTAEPTR